jgi:3-deoxy-7-phosphoheptulonate synthase / chorismate mutase
MKNLNELRDEIDQINQELLRLLNKRAKIAVEIGKEKQKHGHPIYDPIREQQILSEIVKQNEGPFSDDTIIALFKEIFNASKFIQQEKKEKGLLISRARKIEDTIIDVKGSLIGGNHDTLIFGPCSIESHEQLETVAKDLKSKGLRYLRGGAFKPRTSPYDFQGLGMEGLKIMKEVADKYDLISVVEIMDEKNLIEALDYIDIIQVGARNMQNYSLLKELGKVNKPVLLKRGFSATLEEFKLSAEYIMTSGNPNIILCERGIRTYEKATRNTLDISSVPILRQETHLPIIVDVSHAAGRKDILAPLAKAALAAGAHGIMTEIHPNPRLALSDAQQQLNLEEFDLFYLEIKK